MRGSPVRVWAGILNMKRYHFIFTVRFLGYVIFFSGLITFVFMLGPLIQAEVKYRADRILKVKRTIAPALTSANLGNLSDSGDLKSFNEIKANENQIVPVATDFGIVIEKINANARVVPNVDASNERGYVQALTQGVAQALGSTPPGQPGNLYLFSHSTDAPWNIIRFNAVFYLLRELEAGDRVVIFYQNLYSL